MPITDGTTPGSGLPVPGGGSAPPDEPVDNGGRDPGNDRGRLLLLIYRTREEAASLGYLRGRTGFSRSRLWRGAEDLEDLGYVELFRRDPRGPVSRWLDNRGDANDRIFASTFLALTDTGRHSPELREAVSAAEKVGRGRSRRAGRGAPVGGRLRRLLSSLSGTPVSRLRNLSAKATRTISRG